MQGSGIATAEPAVGKGGTVPRAVLVLHRWLGIVIGAVMTLWCLSGFVMIYVDYPRLLPAEQLRGLSPLDLPARSDWTDIDLPPATALSSARVEMLTGRPVLRIVPEGGDERSIWQARATLLNYDLATGAPLQPLSGAEILKVGRAFGRNSGIAGPAIAAKPISVDQWTVQAFRANSPLYRIDYADAAGSSLYVAGGTGEAVQETTRFERFWGWLGSVPHWLYPTMLRQYPDVWAQVVIWTSLTGCFLTITGLWVGIARLKRGRDGTIRSPYRGLWWWHHMAGLFFGLVTLSWVASGLLSMNPLGVFDSAAGPGERHRLAGSMRWADVRQALQNMPRLPGDTLRIETAPLAGRTYLVAVDAHGGMTRVDALGRPTQLGRTDVEAALRGRPAVASLALLREGDAYYYAHKQPVKLPVWRAILADPQRTGLYIDADTGLLLRAVDGASRAERWLWNAPHSLDLPGLRGGLLRSLVMMPLLAAVTLVCATGAWMGFRKLARDRRRARRRRHSPFFTFRRKTQT